MKKLCTKIILFLIPVIAIWVGLELFYRLVDTNFTEKDKQIRTEFKDAEILILGNSHSLFGINPSHFDRRFGL